MDLCACTRVCTFMNAQAILIIVSCVWVTCMHAHCTREGSRVCKHTHTHIHAFIYIHVSRFSRSPRCRRIYYICMYACMYTYVHVHRSVIMCTFAFWEEATSLGATAGCITYAYMYVCMYMDIHIRLIMCIFAGWEEAASVGAAGAEAGAWCIVLLQRRERDGALPPEHGQALWQAACYQDTGAQQWWAAGVHMHVCVYMYMYVHKFKQLYRKLMNGLMQASIARTGVMLMYIFILVHSVASHQTRLQVHRRCYTHTPHGRAPHAHKGVKMRFCEHSRRWINARMLIFVECLRLWHSCMEEALYARMVYLYSHV